MTDPMKAEGNERPAVRDRRRDARMVVTGVVAVLLVWFALVNLQDVEIHFWLTSAKSPLIVVIAIACVLGGGVALLISRSSRRRRPPTE